MSVLFAGSMIVNDGVGAWGGKARGNSQAVSTVSMNSPMMERQPSRDASSNTPNTPMVIQNPASETQQGVPQSQPTGDTQSADTPLNNVEGGSTFTGGHGLHIPEENNDVMGRSYSTPPVVGGGDIFQNLDGHQDVSAEPYVECPNSPNLGNETRTSARRGIDSNYGSGKRPRMDSFVSEVNSVTENTIGGREGVDTGEVNGGDGNTNTGYTPGVPASVFNITSLMTIDEQVRAEESKIIRKERDNRQALFAQYAEIFEEMTEVIDSAIASERFDRFELLAGLERKLRCFVQAPEPRGNNRPIMVFQLLGEVYNTVTGGTTSMCRLVNDVAKEVVDVIDGIFAEGEKYDVDEYKRQLRNIVDIINEKVIINMDPGHLLKGLNFKPSNDESKNDYIVASIQIDDEGFVAIPVDRFCDCFRSIVNVLDDARNLNIDLNIINMATNIVTKVRDRERVLRERVIQGHDYLIYSYAYILQKYFMNFFENVLKSKENLSGSGVRAQTEREQLELLNDLEARICERNRNNPERIENIVMNEVFNVVSRRIEQEKARIRAENAPNDPEVYQVGDTKYSSGTLREAAAEVGRIYASITNKRAQKMDIYIDLGVAVHGNNSTLQILRYGENTDEVRTVWENVLQKIRQAISGSKIIRKEFSKTKNDFLRNNLKL